jgi:hypothetical protein
MASSDVSDHDMLKRLSALEQRIDRIEARLGRGAVSEEASEASADVPVVNGEEREEALELEIGQHWVPRIGIFVLTLGIGFLLAFPFQGLPALAAPLAGYLISGMGFLLNARWRMTLPHLASTVRGGAVALLYFSTLRLAFFTPSPALPNGALETVLLLVVVGGTRFFALRPPSLFLVGVSVGLGFVTALVNGDMLIASLLVIIMTAFGSDLARRYEWKRLALFTAVGSVLSLLLLFLNNPILGNPIRLVPVNTWSVITVLAIIVINAVGTLFRKDEGEPAPTIALTAVNGLVAYLLLLFMTLREPGEVIAVFHSVASVVLLALSVAFWVKEKSTYSTFIYAMLGYGAMSVAILAYFNQPDFFIWLAWQSLLVVSTAVWFRSRIIIGANFFIYLMILGAFISVAPSVGIVSVSFGFVALLSARILNWKKDELALRTEQMRNAYLACALVIFPLALSNGLPADYVTLSWMMVAILYYAVSLILKLRKYRWMALITGGATVARVLIVDMVHLQPAYRIVTFLAVGLVLLWLSIWYARKKTLFAAEKPKETQHVQ